MLRYLREAFWAGAQVRGLGRLPVNALAVAGLAILGFGNEGFWLLGLGLEAGYLALLASNPRFQRWVDATRNASSGEDTDRQRQALVAQLQPESRRRLQALEESCECILQTYREAQAEAYAVEGNRAALDQLRWVYLKLLIARDHLRSSQQPGAEGELARRIADLERELTALPEGALRDSRAATLELLRQRQVNRERSGQALAEVDSDLERVEAQVELALENARLRGRSEVIPAKLELASQLLDDELYFGDSKTAMAALDEAYGQQRNPADNVH